MSISLIGCNQHFVSSESPHLVSITVTNGGSGYTYARAKAIGAMSKGVQLRCKIEDGALSEIIVLNGGRGITTVPEIEITGDGDGAAAEVTRDEEGNVTGIAGGAPVYENTTKVQDWKPKSCDDYRCARDEEDNLITPVEDRPDTCLIKPEPIPDVEGEMPYRPCEGILIQPSLLDNTYALKDPPQFIDFSSCLKRGFKVVFARKEWFGRYGFVDSGPPSQSKYLIKTVTTHLEKSNKWHRTQNFSSLDIPPSTSDGQWYDETENGYIVGDRTLVIAINRYTGRQKVLSDNINVRFIAEHKYETYTGDSDYDTTEETEITSGVDYNAFTALSNTEGAFGKIIIGASPTFPIYPFPEPITPADFDDYLAGKRVPYSEEHFEETMPIYMPHWYTTESETTSEGYATISNEEIHIKEDTIESVHTYGVGPATSPKSASDTETKNELHVTIDVVLSDPYTAADVISDAMSLLSYWNLSDDRQYPWRTDVPVFQTSPMPHYKPNFGPSYGPLVTWGEDKDQNPVIRGKPNPAGYEPFWDSQRENMEFNDDFRDPEHYCWRRKSWGAESPFPHATQWMPDHTNNTFHSGQTATHNSGHHILETCSHEVLQQDGAFIVSKYAEIYLFEFPHHNPARPCGQVDKAAIDQDTIDCETNPTGNLRWPDAPCFCKDPSQTEDCDTPQNPGAVNPENTSKKQGSYSVKSWSWNAGALQAMSCGSGNAIPKPCRPFAVFIQTEPPSGIYADALHLPPVTISVLDEGIIDDVPQGKKALKQFFQAMVDPLWQRPVSCETDEETGESRRIVDNEALPPYEENTECDDGDCEDYDGSTIKNPKCEPWENYTPWAWAAVEGGEL